MMPARFFVVFAFIALAACSGGGPNGNVPGADDDNPFAAIAEGEHINFIGTEPFWGGEITGATLLYRTPDNPDGAAVEVTRFAGRGGLSFSATMGDADFDLVLTSGECSDGMSDRIYPLIATLQLARESRSGCAWSTGQPYTDPPGSVAP